MGTRRSLDSETNATLLSFLEREYERRCQRSGTYSLRLYAKHLEMDQSYLSKILKGRLRIPYPKAIHLAHKLGLTDRQITRLVQNEKQNTEYFAPRQDSDVPSIEDWYYLAIIELFKTNNFYSDANTIARRLGITTEQAELALATLQRMKIVQEEGGKWMLISTNNSWYNPRSTSKSRKTLQKTYLKKASEAVESVPLLQRFNAGLTLAIPAKKVPQFNERLREVCIELSEEFQEANDFDEVYQLLVAFFPLTKSLEN